MTASADKNMGNYGSTPEPSKEEKEIKKLKEGKALAEQRERKALKEANRVRNSLDQVREEQNKAKQALSHTEASLKAEQQRAQHFMLRQKSADHKRVAAVEDRNRLLSALQPVAGSHGLGANEFIDHQQIVHNYNEFTIEFETFLNNAARHLCLSYTELAAQVVVPLISFAKKEIDDQSNHVEHSVRRSFNVSLSQEVSPKFSNFVLAGIRTYHKAIFFSRWSMLKSENTDPIAKIAAEALGETFSLEELSKLSDAEIMSLVDRGREQLCYDEFKSKHDTFISEHETLQKLLSMEVDEDEDEADYFQILLQILEFTCYCKLSVPSYSLSPLPCEERSFFKSYHKQMQDPEVSKKYGRDKRLKDKNKCIIVVPALWRMHPNGEMEKCVSEALVW